MRIAQIAPLHERVPPRLYGGTEGVGLLLTEAPVRQGHEVVLFASGDSKTSAQLVPCCEMALRLNPSVRDHLPYHMIMLEEVRQRIDQFDILHFHIDLLHGPLVRAIANWTLTTLHGRLDLPDLVPFYQTFRELPLVSISNDQQRYLHNVNWLGTVYHGLPRDLLAFQSRAGGYLAFLGRIAPEKRPDLAIEIAARTDGQVLMTLGEPGLNLRTKCPAFTPALAAAATASSAAASVAHTLPSRSTCNPCGQMNIPAPKLLTTLPFGSNL